MEKLEDLIILRSAWGKVGNKYFICPTIDPKTKRFPPCVKQIDSKGDMILTDKERNDGNIYIPVNRVFIIEDGYSFNLEDPISKAEWESIQFSPAIALSRELRDANNNLLIDGDAKKYGVAELYVERPGFVVNKKINRRKLVHRADTLILEDPKGQQGRIFMARLLGRNIIGAADADITDYLLDVSSKDPEKIINLYSSDDLSYRLLFLDARDRGIIYVKDKVYMYGDSQIVLGATDDLVITWMRRPNNSKIIEMIRRGTYPEMYQEEELTKESKPKK